MEDWKEIKNNDDNKEYILFDDRELDELEGTEEETIELDEEFEKQVSKELDELLKEHPLEYEE